MQTQFRLTQIEKGKDMQEELLNKLRQVTEEERLILQGASQIQSNLYTTQFAKPSDFTIDSKKPVSYTHLPFTLIDCFIIISFFLFKL